MFRIAGTGTTQILKGDKSANVPLQQMSKFEFFTNLNTAKALELDCVGWLFACRLGDRMKRREFFTLLGGAAAA